eukprot:Rhum_TRINITY_DN20422_c0_g1::Rhum_TRINITY_DN20422_c0_g1_i1::g.171415::m.171415
MASLDINLVSGSDVRGKFLKRSEQGYMINPKLVVEVASTVAGQSERVEKTRDPEWNQKLTLPLPPSARAAHPVTFKVVHANNYGGEERVVGYVRRPLSDGGSGAAEVQELKLLSEDTGEEHGGVLRIGWAFTPAPPQAAEPESAPVPEAVTASSPPAPPPQAAAAAAAAASSEAAQQ